MSDRSLPHRAMRLMCLAGLFALTVVVLGWMLGGQALLGRIDPALAIPTLLLAALPVMARVRGDTGQRRLILASLCAAILIAVQGGLDWVLAGSNAPGQLATVAVAAAAALLVADLFWRRRAGRRGGALLAGSLLILLWFAGSHILLSRLYAPRAADNGMPPLLVMTSLPLGWGGSADVGTALQRGWAPAPALARLDADFTVRMVDAFAGTPMTDRSVLLLAHPRALPPADLVAIDAFVRKGGHAVILADALSSWPVDFPLGDARNPPVTSLLTPLLDHWGVTLGGADMADQKPLAFDVDGHRVMLFSAGKFDRLPKGCRTNAGRRIADCLIGRGRVSLVGDADLLFAPLWQSPVAGADHLRRADTMVWLGALIGGPRGGGDSVLQPLWIRSPGVNFP